jgi:hypothetical protein
MNRLVENRFRYAGPKSWRPRHFAFACGALVIVTVLVAFSAQWTGWTWRLGDREGAYLDIRTIYGGAACPPPRCETGAGEPLIVIGDSHARALFAGMAAHLPERRLIFYESPACPFYSPDKTRDYGTALADYDEPCRFTRRRAFDEIRTTGADVVVAQNWYRLNMVSEMSGDRWEFSSDAEYLEFVSQELGELKRALRIQNLVVVGNVPMLGGGDMVSPLDCISRPVRLNDIGCTSTPVTHKAISSRREFNVALKARVASFARFTDPFDYLCDGDACANFLDGRPLYFNRTHLSELGSSVVVEGMLSSAPGSLLIR